MTAAQWWGVGLSAAGSLLGGRDRKRQANEQAYLQRVNAALARRQGRLDARDIRRAGSAAIGSARAAIGASGITGEGSAADIVASSLFEIENAVLENTFSRELEAMGFNLQAQAYKRQGRDADRAGLIGGATDFLVGMGR